jgi:hypothetical protein
MATTIMISTSVNPALYGAVMTFMVRISFHQRREQFPGRVMIRTDCSQIVRGKPLSIHSTFETADGFVGSRRYKTDKIVTVGS